MSCTAPARQTPATSHSKPGANPNCAASTGPMQRARAGDGGEVVAEQHPPVRGVIVVAVAHACARA